MNSEGPANVTINQLSNVMRSGRVTVSVHYIVGQEGEIRRIVPEEGIAFHTRGHDDNSIGIMLAHLTGQPYPQAQLDALTDLNLPG